MQFSEELNDSRKDFIRIKNKDNKYFCWYHIRHLNPMSKNAQKIKKSDKNWLYNNLYTKKEFSKLYGVVVARE